MTSTAERIRQVEESVNRLAYDVDALRAQLARDTQRELRHALRRRGLVWKKALHEGCVVPPTAKAQEELYQLLQHYSFRLFLRDVIKHRERFGLADLLRYCSPASGRRYLRWLRDHKLVRGTGKHFHLAIDAVSFGPTLEWFVSRVLEHEYGIPSGWNIRLDAARGGGDYDVVGLQEGTCVYIETKSSPPRNIEVTQVRAFLDRVETLRPDVAIFLNDTQLRMGDKIVVLFTAALRHRLGRRAAMFPLERLSGEIFVAAERLFIANSAPDLVGNIGLCLAQYFRAQGLHWDRRR
ncbi:MAG: hypothetical protein ACE5I7_14635 [Candidatus Binatia bacterium]